MTPTPSIYTDASDKAACAGYVKRFKFNQKHDSVISHLTPLHPSPDNHPMNSLSLTLVRVRPAARLHMACRSSFRGRESQR